MEMGMYYIENIEHLVLKARFSIFSLQSRVTTSSGLEKFLTAPLRAPTFSDIHRHAACCATTNNLEIGRLPILLLIHFQNVRLITYLATSRKERGATSSMNDSNVTTTSAWTRKPLSIVLQEQEEEESTAHRHLSLVDLVSVGVGGTVGSGIFVLTGLIAHNYAGPSTFISFILSGFAASCSGLCYAEWSGRLPAAGSTYVYAYVSLGEWAAVIAGACLTLEYGVSGAAVARSWGDKVVEWLSTELHWESAASHLGGEYFNPLAGLISALSVLILTCGVKESKAVTNFFTVLKILLVIFMIIGGALCFRKENMTPMAPLGAAGIFRGATSSFFGYLGYDEVCCLASEAKKPSDMPRAVLWTLVIVTTLYVLASIALVGMVPYEDISETSGFPAAFSTRGIAWAAQFTAAGEVITLPVVVLIALLAQPRLCAAMAHDHLLPEIFGRTDERGNLFWSNILCGVPMTILATVVPFSFLDDAISVGILIAFNMTNSSLILMKCEYRNHTHSISKNLIFFHALAFGTGLASHIKSPKWTPLVSVAVTVCFAIYLHRRFPPTGSFGSLLRHHDSNVKWDSMDGDDRVTFQAPCMPLLPLLGCAMNWYLIAQLEWSGMLLLLFYLGLVTALYMIFGDNKRPWAHHYDSLHQDDDTDGHILLREFSTPKRSGG